MSETINANYIRVNPPAHVCKGLKVTQSSTYSKPVSYYVCETCSIKMKKGELRAEAGK